MVTSTLDPRTPIIAGVGQWSNRVDQGADPVSPVELMVEASRRAATDAGATGALGDLDAVRVVGLLSWRYRDPGRLVAQALGSPDARTGLTTMGGNSPQSLVSRTSAEILAGDLDLAIVCGGEAWRTRKHHQRGDTRPPWTEQDDDVRPDELIGADLVMSHEAETTLGLVSPIQMYALFDHAIRIAAGRTIDAQRELVGRLWSGFSEVASTNPHAWRPARRSPTEIAEPGPENRLVCHPYAKAVNSYEWVDQGAALLVCSVEKARSLGIPEDRWVFPVAGADAAEPSASLRWDLHRSVSMAACGEVVLAHAGIGVDDLGVVDLYSCFPSAVQMAAAELGLSLDRPLTVTGGMSFFGGPWNDYASHSIATLVERLREDPADPGLITANGGMTSKQSFGVYAAQPPDQPFRHDTTDAQALTDRAEQRDVAPDHTGPATVEAWTVTYDRDGSPEQAFIAALTEAGERTWCATPETAVIDGLQRGDLDGASIVTAAGRVTDVG